LAAKARLNGTNKRIEDVQSERVRCLDLLKIGGRAAVIVPDGVLFGSTKTHRELRRQLLFENTLEAVVSLPANMFQPYSGVKTSILIFQKANETVAAGSEPRTREVWFYEVANEAFSLNQKRKALYGQDNDLWDALVKFDAWNRYRQGEAENALTSEAPDRTADWLHPVFRPASTQVQIRLNGNPSNSIPQLCSPDPTEQIRIKNHFRLIRTLSKRWMRRAAAHYDLLVRQVNERVNAANTVDSLVRTRLEEHLDSRGQAPSSMVHAAVCQAVLDRRSEYFEEFANPNAPTLEEK